MPPVTTRQQTGSSLEPPAPEVRGEDGVVTRIRLDASGPTVEKCRDALLATLELLAGTNGFPDTPTYSVEVYERDLGDSFAPYHGRMVLNPRVS